MRDYTRFMEPRQFDFITDRIDQRFPDYHPPEIKYMCVIFEVLNKGVEYHYSGRNVPPASEMLDRLSGDCEDQSVLINSMSEAAGLETGFIRVSSPQKQGCHLISVIRQPLDDVNVTCNEVRKFYLETWNREVRDIYYDEFNGKDWLFADNFSNYLGDGQSLVSEGFIDKGNGSWSWVDFKSFLSTRSKTRA